MSFVLKNKRKEKQTSKKTLVSLWVCVVYSVSSIIDKTMERDPVSKNQREMQVVMEELAPCAQAELRAFLWVFWWWLLGHIRVSVFGVIACTLGVSPPWYSRSMWWEGDNPIIQYFHLFLILHIPALFSVSQNAGRGRGVLTKYSVFTQHERCTFCNCFMCKSPGRLCISHLCVFQGRGTCKN